MPKRTSKRGKSNRPKGRKARGMSRAFGNMSIGRVVKLPNNMPHGVNDFYRFNRIYKYSTNTLTAGSPQLFALVFNQATVPSAVSTFFAAWDLFRIESIDVRIIPHWSVNTTSGIGTDDEIPQIAWVLNIDDSNAPSSFDAVLGQGAARMRRFDREIRFRTYPRIQGPTTSTGSVAYIATGPSDTWYNTAAIYNFSSIFYMAKVGVSAVASVPGAGVYDVYFDLHLTFCQHTT